MKKSPFRKAANRFLHLLCRFLPGATTVRPFLHRLRGVKIQGSVFIGDEVYIENEYPECVEIHDQAQIALRTTIITHINGPGKVVIGKKAFIGANCVIVGAPGRTVTIGEGAVLTASSVASTSIPPYTLWRGNPAEPVAKVTVPLTAETSYEEFTRGLTPLTRKKHQRQ